MDEDELQRLLAFAERIVEAGIDPDLVRVQSVRAETDELMILDTSPGPPTASIWDSLVAQSKVFSEPELILCVSDALAADDVLETEPNELDTIAEPPSTMQIPGIASQSELMFGSGSSGLRTERIQSFASGYSENDVDEASSPVRELPPMALFRESQPNPAGNARTGKQYDPAPDTPILDAYVINHGEQGDTPAGSSGEEYSDSPAQHDQFGVCPSIALLQACRSRSTIFLRGAEVPSGRFTTEASLPTGDVVYYWVTHTHRVGDNLALAFALQLSRELTVPLVALAVIENADVHANTRGPRSSSGENAADIAPPWTPHQRDVLASLRRRSAIRRAVLRNFQKDLAAIGVPLVCASYSALLAGNDASSSAMTSALVPRAEAEHPVVAMWRTICRTGSSSRYHEDDSKYRENTIAALVVTDSCQHPLTRFLCERVSAVIGSSAVVAIDSNSLALDSGEWMNSHVDRMGSNESYTVEPCWALLGKPMQASVLACSASEAAAQVLESVYYCSNIMRLVDLAAVVETTATETSVQRKRQRTQEELVGEHNHTDEEEFLASWSVAAATGTLLRACGAWDETKPRENFSPAHGEGALNRTVTHIRTAAAAPADGLGYIDSAEISSAERRALFSHVVDYVGYGLISPPVLHRALRSPLCVSSAEQASFRRELTDFITSRMQAQRELARRVSVTAATCSTTDADQFSVSWLDLISAETVAQMRQFDPQLPRGTLVQAQQQLELLRSGATDCAVFNAMHHALTDNGVIPVDRHLRYLIVYQARQLRSMEAAVRVAYTALAAHGNVSLDQCALRMLTFVEALQRVVRELGSAIEENGSRDANALSGMSAYLSQLL